MKKVTVFMIALLFLAGCNGANDVVDVSVDEAKEMIQDEDVIILDVRTEGEYVEGHIPGAILLPLQQLEQSIAELDKEKQYFLVCRSGNRSYQAGKILIEYGFEHVSHLADGMLAWDGEVVKGKD